MCFAPQQRALFRHLNFQKWSEPLAFWTFWLRNVFRATTACNFSSLIWPDGSAPAALASLLFDPPEPQIIGKNRVSRDFPTFSRTCIFSLLTLSLLWSSLFCSSLFYSSLLSDSSHLCFSSVHIVGSLTSKFPSIMYDTILSSDGYPSMRFHDSRTQLLGEFPTIPILKAISERQSLIDNSRHSPPWTISARCGLSPTYFRLLQPRLLT